MVSIDKWRLIKIKLGHVQ